MGPHQRQEPGLIGKPPRRAWRKTAARWTTAANGPDRPQTAWTAPPPGDTRRCPRQQRDFAYVARHLASDLAEQASSVAVQPPTLHFHHAKRKPSQPEVALREL